VESRSTRHCGHLMAYCISPGWLWSWRNRWNDWQGKPKYSEKTCVSAALSTTKPTCCPYANPGLRGEKPASNRWATARPETPTYIIISALCLYLNALAYVHPLASIFPAFMQPLSRSLFILVLKSLTHLTSYLKLLLNYCSLRLVLGRIKDEPTHTQTLNILLLYLKGEVGRRRRRSK
jgi:hypothetical protein